MPRKSSSSYSRRYAPRRTLARAPIRRAPVRYAKSRVVRTTSRNRPNAYGAQIGRYIGSMVGSAGSAALAEPTGGLSLMLAPAASKVSGQMGSWLGSRLQGLISGHGDYRINANTLMGSSVPSFKKSGPRAVCVTHREFITDVIATGTPVVEGGGTAFVNNRYTINPGNAGTFPWLSNLAQLYEQYQIKGMIFEYKTSSGNTSTSPQLGTVVMATQYNSLSPTFTNKQEMENYEFAASIVPSRDMIHPIECDPKQTQCGGIFNVATPGIPLGDSRLYDLGTFNIATVGMPVQNGTVGELWVSYDICFLKPRLNSGASNQTDHWISAGTGVVFSTAYFGSAFQLTGGSDGFTNITNTTIQFSKSFYGQVLISLFYSLPSASGGAPQCPLLTPDGVSVTNDIVSTELPFFDQSQAATIRPVATATGTQILLNSVFNIQPAGNGSTPTITLSSGSLGGSTCNWMDLLITQIPNDIS